MKESSGLWCPDQASRGSGLLGLFEDFGLKLISHRLGCGRGEGGGGQGSIQRRASMLELYSRSPKLGNPIASILKSNV